MNPLKKCAAMPARKMRVELFDGDGNRYTIAFEGLVTREKAVRLLDLVELLGGMPTGDGAGSRSGMIDKDVSKYERVRRTAEKSFPLAWFSSKELQDAYEQEFKEPIALSTTATYLARLTTRGILMKSGAVNNLRYRVVHGQPNAQIKQTLN